VTQRSNFDNTDLTPGKSPSAWRMCASPGAPGGHKHQLSPTKLLRDHSHQLTAGF